MAASKFERPNLIFALVAAAGTDLSEIKTQLKAQLASFEYEYAEIKLSQLIGGLCKIDTAGKPEDERILSLMYGGDKIRAATASGDGVICLAVTAIRALRAEIEKRREASPGAIAFVIDSLKNPDEIDTLRSVYGNNLYVVSVYAKEKAREARLASKIAASCTSTVRKEHRIRAQRIIAEDLKRDNSGWTQNVEATFPNADFFVSSGEDSSKQIKRFIELVFGEPFITPTLPEFAMFVAKATALRSCDLSRQVGALIVDNKGAILSSGCNDVPYPQGGMFYEGRGGDDNRDHVVKADPNFSEIANVFTEIVEAFRSAEILDPEVKKLEDGEIVRRLLHGEWREAILLQEQHSFARPSRATSARATSSQAASQESSSSSPIRRVSRRNCMNGRSLRTRNGGNFRTLCSLSHSRALHRRFISARLRLGLAKAKQAKSSS